MRPTLLALALFFVLPACTAGNDPGLTPGGGGGDSGVDGPNQAGITAPLVRIEELTAGEECAEGGVTIAAGIDSDNDGILGNEEVEERFVLCNGPAGPAGDAGAAGADGVNGDAGDPGGAGDAGPKGDPGADGADGAAGAAGAAGDPGPRGDPGDQGPRGEEGIPGNVGDSGLNALIRLEQEPPGEPCPTGGVWVLAGLDADDDGELSDEEITERQLVCNGLRGPAGNGEALEALLRLTEIPPGDECNGGGVRIEVGADVDGDGELEDHEVEQSVVICNGSLCDSPDYHDGGDGSCIPTGTCIADFHNGGDGSCVPVGECIEGLRDGGGGLCVPEGECAPNFRPDPQGGDGCVPACEEGEHDNGVGVCVDEDECAEGFHDGGDGRCIPVGECLEGFHDGGGGTCVPIGECARRYIDVNGICVPNLESLFDFESHTFTNCGKTGRAGPSIDQCAAAYQAAEWAEDRDNFDVVGGIQQWSVPEDRRYRIEAWGAQGGAASGGAGAYMSGEFELALGDVLQILVGQRGGTAPEQVGNGGGGGSFVIIGDDEPLLIAAGGGGTGHNNNAGNAQQMRGQTGTSGLAGIGQNPGAGGQNGNGGGEGYTTGGVIPNSGGGGGLLTDGGSAGAARGGQAFVNGGLGGDSTGGFGGGGGSNVFIYGCGRSPHGGSGGGGFSGGGGGSINCNGVGGGGGSFNGGEEQGGQVGQRAGPGQVVITAL